MRSRRRSRRRTIAGRLLPSARRRWLGQRLLLALILLQTTFLVAMAFTERWPVMHMGLFELLWASAHRPLFYVFLALLLGGPACTVAAWRLCPGHRGWFVAWWAAFLVLAGTFFADRILMMSRVVLWAVEQELRD